MSDTERSRGPDLGLDLNLLVTLDVLLAERNVTRAAQRLRLAQPSVSAQLARLRAHFGDPLLLPGPRGMRPTARGDELREPLRQALTGLAQAVRPGATFDPARAAVSWTVMASDYSELVVLVPMMARLRAEAPGTRLAVLQSHPAHVARLADTGVIDLCLHTMHDAPARLRRRSLFRERYVLVGRKDHPKLRRRPTLAQFGRLEHVLVSPDGGGFVGPTDEALATAGATRRVVLSVPHFSVATAAVASSDLVAMLPERLVLGRADLRIVAAPVAVPGYELGMLWPERLHRDPAHRWLRDLVAYGLRSRA